MAPKKLSYEEKRTRLLQLFYETEDFFNLKELEKLGHKRKGIVSQTVKEILQSLVDDNLVDTERIGLSNYFWAYPSKGFKIRKQKIEELEKELEELNAKIETLDKDLVEQQAGREETDGRKEALKILAELNQHNAQMEAEYQQFKESDPDIIDGQKKKIKLAAQSANRWTDNIYNVKTWCRDKFNIASEDIDKNFDIPEDIDYLEE